MKPYGREKNIKGSGIWKKDFHIHEKNRKVGNWWETLCEPIPRAIMKLKVQQQIFTEIQDNDRT